ncbi:MAG: hypothetical protein J0J01_27795 [Reyranella sp.]|uniref:hypothetical protein n=1 Tax=Reyranella sp. TaxID=1929291 RepID=UPI001AD58C42|nr:hypothetical protein [Reyranella sp.]MBN9090733.1 hypothetical protein [Reyranella sp.]
MRVLGRASALVILSLGAAGGVIADAGTPMAAHVRSANERLEDVTAALAEGYTAIPCADGFDGATAVHYVNSKYLQDAVPDIGRPQGLLYENNGDGRLTLVAVEYVTMAGPVSLGGQPFKLLLAPDRYRLVVWAWKPNPLGGFAEANPDASCE